MREPSDEVESIEVENGLHKLGIVDSDLGPYHTCVEMELRVGGAGVGVVGCSSQDDLKVGVMV